MTQAPEALAEPAAARPTLLLVDGSSYLYRAFHAMPDLRADPGTPARQPQGASHDMIDIQYEVQ